MRTTEKELAEKLRAKGFKVNRIAPWDIDADGEVDLEDGFSVQVGHGYVMLTRTFYEGPRTPENWRQQWLCDDVRNFTQLVTLLKKHGLKPAKEE